MSYNSIQYDTSQNHIDFVNNTAQQHRPKKTMKKYKSVDLFKPYSPAQIEPVILNQSIHDDDKDYIIELKQSDRRKKFVKMQFQNQVGHNFSKLNQIKSCINFNNIQEDNREFITYAFRVKHLHFIPNKASKVFKLAQTHRKNVSITKPPEMLNSVCKSVCCLPQSQTQMNNFQKAFLARQNDENKKLNRALLQTSCSKCTRQKAIIQKLTKLITDITKFLEVLKMRQLLIKQQIVDCQKQFNQLASQHFRVRQSTMKEAKAKQQLDLTEKQLLIRAVIRDVQKAVDYRLNGNNSRQSKIGTIVSNTAPCINRQQQLKKVKQSNIFKEISLDLSRVSSQYSESLDIEFVRIRKLKQQINDDLDFDKTVLKL